MEEDVSHIAKQRELAADMAKSAYYITPKDAVKDVERYSDGLHLNGCQGQSLASQLSAGMKRYLPPELTDRPSKGAAGALAGLNPLPAFDAKSLTALEDKERKNAETGAEKAKDKNKDDDAGMVSDIEAEVEEEEQDDDYAVDHYESGDESAGDDEPAAVF